MAGHDARVQLGIIGCGRVTYERHLLSLQGVQQAEVVAVADTSPERLNRAAEAFKIPHRYRDYRAMLELPDLHAVAVCTPTQFHVEMGLAALDAGKHVFMEKPLALSLDDADRLIARAAESRRKVMVGFNLRWHRLVRQARDIIQSGSLGPLELLRSVFTAGSRYRKDLPEWRLQHALGGGLLLEQAVHHFDLWSFLLQSEIEEVFAKCVGEQSPAERTTVAAQLANGVLAASVFSEGMTEDNTLEIYGRSGRLQVSCYLFDGLQLYTSADGPGAMRTRLRGLVRALREFPAALLRLREGGDYVASYRAEWRHFVHAIQHDTAVEPTLQDGRRALQVGLAAIESAASGHAVKVANAPVHIPPLAGPATGASGSRNRERL